MEAVHRAYPDDLEAAAFYSLALLGLALGARFLRCRDARASGRSAYPDAAAAVAQEVFRWEPKHRGGAHYILHAFADPDHAVLGLLRATSARMFAQCLAPDT